MSPAPDPTDAKQTVATRLTDADLDADRFAAVKPGRKTCYDHTQRASERVQGPFAVFGGGALIIADVDDTDAEGADGLDDLPPTFTVESPHTAGGREGHHYYKIEGYEEHGEAVGHALAAVFRPAKETYNPVPAWGEVQTHNKYAVGPGAQLAGCDTDGCEACARPDSGYYRIAADRPIATISFETLCALLRAGGVEEQEQGQGGAPDAAQYEDVTAAGDDASDDNSDTAPDEAGEDTTDASRAEAVAQHDDRLATYLAVGAKAADFTQDDGSGDRSAADFYACCRLLEYGVDEGEAYTLLAGEPTTKVNERDRDYWRETWTSARQEVGADEATERLPDDPPIPGPAGQPSATDGGSATADTTGGGAGGADEGADDGPAHLSPAMVRVYGNVGEDGSIDDLTDREKAAVVWQLLWESPRVHVRVRRDNGTLWGYDDGIWSPEGERALRHAARQALGPINYGPNVLTELAEQARADPRAEIEADALGLDPGLLAVENGLLDLDAAAAGDDDPIRPLRPDDLALTRIPVTFDPDAPYDEWAALVAEWAEDGKAPALQEHVGYCLHVGALPIHRALLLVGSGANGKGTFLAVVRALLGDENTTAMELQTLANERDAVADFYGALANIDDDLSARKLGKGLGMFKKLTAGDRVRTRNLYEDGFEFDATGKHLYAANTVPDVSSDVAEDDEAFWRRWLLVEFPNHYPPTEREPDLRVRLTEPDALSGVLNWAIEGRARLLDQGYFTNEHRYAQAKRERWQAWGDSVDQFIQGCVEHDPDAPNLTTGDAHRIFRAWCRENDAELVGQQQLTNTLKQEDVGYARSVRVEGSVQRGYTALGLTDDTSEPPAEGEPDHDTPGQQASFDQAATRRAVYDAVRECAADHPDGTAPEDEVLAAAADTAGSTARARHYLDKLCTQGDVIEDPDGHYRPG